MLAPLPRHELRAALAAAVSRVFAQFYGRGPSATRVWLLDEFVLAVCDDVLTTVEETLRSGGDAELVSDVRLAFQDLMTRAFVDQVEHLTGRTVVGYHSQVLVGQDEAIELFVLDPADGTAAGDGGDEQAVAAEPDPGAPATERPGEPGDADRLPGPGQRPGPAARASLDAGRRHGPQRMAVGNAVVRLMTESYGRGPTRTRTYFAGRHVLCALEEPLTTVERTLAEGGRRDLVRRMRRRFVAIEAERLGAAVEPLTGRRVLACEAQVVFEPDVLFLVFALDGEPVPTEALGDAG